MSSVSPTCSSSMCLFAYACHFTYCIAHAVIEFMYAGQVTLICVHTSEEDLVYG